MKGYSRFCPIAMACETFAERWTPLILRELLFGARRFNEIRQGMPLISRTLLGQRLRELEAAGIMRRASNAAMPTRRTPRRSAPGPGRSSPTSAAAAEPPPYAPRTHPARGGRAGVPAATAGQAQEPSGRRYGMGTYSTDGRVRVGCGKRRMSSYTSAGISVVTGRPSDLASSAVMA
jgi:hypothetical protein